MVWSSRWHCKGETLSLCPLPQVPEDFCSLLVSKLSLTYHVTKICGTGPCLPSDSPNVRPYSCWVAITGVLIHAESSWGGELFLQPGSKALHGHRYTCTHSTASAHKYSPHRHSCGEQTGRVPYASYTRVRIYTSVHMELISLALMLLGAYISEPGSFHGSIKYEKSRVSLTATVSNYTKVLSFTAIHTKGRRSGCERM